MTSTFTAAETRAVPFFNYPSVFTAHEEEFVAIFRDVGRSGAFIMQKHLARFEENLEAAFVGSRDMPSALVMPPTDCSTHSARQASDRETR